MAINKDKNVLIQVTFPKEDAEHLQSLKDAYEKEDIKVTKSQILLHSFREYIKLLIMAGTTKEDKEAKKEEKDNA